MSLSVGLFGNGTEFEAAVRPRQTVRAVLVFAMASLTIGCGGRLFQVTRQKPPDPPTLSAEQCRDEKNIKSGACEMPGIPFYVVKHRCVHSTAWLEPVYVVTLTASSDDPNKPPHSETVLLGLREFQDRNTQATLASLKASPSAPNYDATFKTFQTLLPGFDPLTFDEKQLGVAGSDASRESMLISNTVVSERYVDANAVYYYNIMKPRSGTANAEVDLNDEGVLSKASAQVEDKTLATVLGALPISDLIKGAAGLAPVSVPPAKAGDYKFDLNIQTRLYKHTHSLPLSSVPPCSPDASLVGENPGIPFNSAVEDVTNPAAPEKPDMTSKNAKPKKP